MNRKTKLKYWYYRNIKYRASRFKCNLSEAYFEPGWTVYYPDGRYGFSLGKGWFVTPQEFYKNK